MENTGPTVRVKNITNSPVRVNRYIVPPGREIDGVPISFAEAFLRRGCEVIRQDGSTMHPEGQATGHAALFAFESVDTSIEYSRGISVIIPTYNRARVFGAAVNSVLMQAYPNLEIVIVDDGSQDNTLAQIPGIETAADKAQCLLTYIRTNKNMGISAARNLGVMVAKHDNIVTLDSDDRMVAGAMSLIAPVSYTHLTLPTN